MNASEIKNFGLKLKRRAECNKYDFGHILVIAGSKNMVGAGVLCANAVMRCGAGLVTYACGENFLAQAASMSKPESMFFSYRNSEDVINFVKTRKVSAAVIGPGLQISRGLKGFINKIISSIDIAVVLDASALSAYSSGKVSELKSAKAKLILTPHLGEFAKLQSIDKDAVKTIKNRIDCVKNFSKRNSLICLLKGRNTIVSDGNKVYVNGTGAPAMATAGSGDVLSAVIAAFAARGFDIFEAAKFGAYVHGLAGELAQKEKGENGVIASDICEYVPYVLKQIINKRQ